MASNIKVDIVKPTATNGSLSLKGDSGGSATANGITVNSSGNTSITGTTTLGGNLVIPDSGTIGSTSATGAITIDSSGNVDVNGSYQGAGNIITSSGIIRSPDGSAAVPSIQPGVDNDTGFFRPTDNTIGFSTGGTERMRIDSSGNVQLTGSLTAGTLGSGVTFPAGHVIQVVQSQFNPTVESTTNTSYQHSTVFKVIQKKSTSSKILAILSGGYFYVTAFANGSITTICQTSNSTSFTPTTTYSSGDDPTSNSAYGMEQSYNTSVINTVPHSISWLFNSSGNEYEGFRCFFKSRTSGKTAVFHEVNSSYITLTLMEIAQ